MAFARLFPIDAVDARDDDLSAEEHLAGAIA
jgi:hypothetical protein